MEPEKDQQVGNRASRSSGRTGATRKKEYIRPVLLEYGSVAKLTQIGGLSGADGGGMMVCL